jgi:hypothetical protein
LKPGDEMKKYIFDGSVESVSVAAIKKFVEDF